MARSRFVSSGFTVVTFVVVVSLVLVLALSLIAAPSAQAASNGTQIRFWVKGGSTFTYLKIVGNNQRGEMKTWSIGNLKTKLPLAETTGWWWQGTIVLRFYVTSTGWRNCVIDYLKEPAGSQFVSVVYTEGEGCSGDRGSGASSRVAIEKLDKALSTFSVTSSQEDGFRIAVALKQSRNQIKCANALADGLLAAGPGRAAMKVVKVSWDCKGAALDVINKVLKSYNRSVELDNSATSSQVTTLKIGTPAETQKAWEAQTSWLSDLAPQAVGRDYFGETSNFSIVLTQDRPLIWEERWCVFGDDRLEQNLANLTLQFSINGVPLKPEQLYVHDAGDGVLCKIYSVVISSWPPGKSVLEYTATIDGPLDNGMNMYLTGTTKFVYSVTRR
jgi:hypothetical protein